MAVDSHEDNQYELTIDSVNNNFKNIRDTSVKSECSDLSFFSIYDNSTETVNHGSAKRKCTSVSKGISIKEFLNIQDTCQFSAIDKLLQKNKALVENQMKQARTKPAKETVSGKKKEKVKKDKVLCSKISLKRKPNGSAKNPKQIKRKVKNQNDKQKKKTKRLVKLAKAKPLKKEKIKDAKKPSEKNSPESKKIERVNGIGSETKKTPEKNGSARKARVAKTSPVERKRKNLTQKSKGERLTDLKSFKCNAFHKTRSFAKVQLRNGKNRIIQEKTSPSLPRRIRRLNGSIENQVANERTPLKRTIKQEPFDDDVGARRKKKKLIDEVGVPDSFIPLVNGGKDEKLGIEINDMQAIKQEFDKTVKNETKESESVTIEEINVVNKDLTNSDNIFVYRDENDANHSNIYVLQDLGSYVKEIEKKSSKGETLHGAVSARTKDEIEIIDDSTGSEEEFSLQDPNTESEDMIDEDISLQYHSDDNDIEECNSLTKQVQVKKTEPPVNEQIPTNETASEIKESELTHGPEIKSVSENTAVKESILGALGLQSLEKINQKTKEKDINYTGTLKAVIKVDKGCRRMEMKQKDSYAINLEGLQNESVLSFYSKIQTNNRLESFADHTAEPNIEKPKTTDADVMNGNAKPHDEQLVSSIREAERSFETDYDPIDQGGSQSVKDKNKVTASLVVPEKSSSFSIHPNRLCYDVCKYCFGKFGSLDTPCHVGQMKNPERQRKILLCEPNLKLDTCLCDACYRYVDRKANKPPIKRNKNSRRAMSINQRTVCAIQNCDQYGRHLVKRKCLLRLSKKIGKLSFDVNKRGPGMNYSLCSQHYYLVDFYTLCGICKKRLNRNQMYSIRSELNDMNQILMEDSIPIKLVDNMLLCRLCHYYMSLRLKYGHASKMSQSNRQYYQKFRKKVLMYYNVFISDSEDANSSEGQKSENGDTSSPERRNLNAKEVPKSDSNEKHVKKNQSVDIQDIADLLKPLEGDGDKNSTRIQVKFGNLNIGKLSNLNIGQNTQTEVKHDKSEDKELPLVADFNFKTPVSGQKNWEKCVSTILFDKGTKKLWQDLQKPYGNQSSFIRHLIMLEKYWRSGSLVLSDTADLGAVKYINSVKNRVESFEITSPNTNNLPTLQPTFNIPNSTPVQVENTSVKHIPAPPPLLKIDQLNNVPFNIRKSLDQPKLVPVQSNSKPVYRSCENISLGQYTEMMQPMMRTKQLTEVNQSSSQVLGVSILKRPSTSSKVIVNTSTSKPYSNGLSNKTYPPSSSNYSSNSSLLISKLPKALTVTQIGEPMKEKTEEKPHIPTQFLAGEKPSVTVFREISKL